MNALHKSRPILVGLAIGVLLALFIAPQTRWIERAQISSYILLRQPIRGVGFKNEPSAQQEYGAIAAAHPHDYQMQLAYTIMSAESNRHIDWGDVTRAGDPRVTALRGLTPEFGGNPSLYGNILRLTMLAEMRMGNRPEDWLIQGQEPPADSSQFSEVSSPQVYAAYDHDAAAGERLDPDNAYFPFMRAWGLFAQHRDDDAIAELLRAGKGSRFDDYSTDEVEGDWKLNQALVGGQDSIARLAFEAALLFPHYAMMREVARIAAYKAILLEQGRQYDQGLAIRNALMHVGSLMRVQSHSFIGTLVGIAITRIAIVRPGGIPYVKPPENADSNVLDNGNAAEARQVDAFCRYLERIGHSDEIPWVRAEIAAGVEAKALLQTEANNPSSPFPDVPLRILPWWAAGMLLLWAVFWLIVLGIAATILSRNPRVRAGQPLPAETQWGVAVATVAAVAGLVAALVNVGIGWLPLIILIATAPLWIVCLVRGFQISVWRALLVILLVPLALSLIAATYSLALMPGLWAAVGSVAFAAVPVLMGWLLLPRGKELLARIRNRAEIGEAAQRTRWPMAAAFIATLMVIAAIFGLMYWQIRQGSDIVAVIADLGVFNGYSNQSNSSSLQTVAIAYSLAAVFFFVILPGCVMAIVGLVKKEPVSVALVTGYQAWAVPIASVLLIVYGPLVLVTVEREKGANYVLEQTVQNEGAYLAQLSGLQWPGAVPYPDPSMEER